MPTEALAATRELVWLIECEAVQRPFVLMGDASMLQGLMLTMARRQGLSIDERSSLQGALGWLLRMAQGRVRRSQESWPVPNATPDATPRRQRGLELAAQRPVDATRLCAEVMWCGEAHWDGSGMPPGLAGEGIPWVARNFKLVHAFCGLAAVASRATGRVDFQRCLNLVAADRGRRFDPASVEALRLSLPSLLDSSEEPERLEQSEWSGRPEPPERPGQPQPSDGPGRLSAGVSHAAGQPRMAPTELGEPPAADSQDLARAEIERLLHGMVVANGVREFLLVFWSDVLAQAARRHGWKGSQAMQVRQTAVALILEAAQSKAPRPPGSDPGEQPWEALRQGLQGCGWSADAAQRSLRKLQAAMSCHDEVCPP